MSLSYNHNHNRITLAQARNRKEPVFKLYLLFYFTRYCNISAIKSVVHANWSMMFIMMIGLRCENFGLNKYVVKKRIPYLKSIFYNMQIDI